MTDSSRRYGSEVSYANLLWLIREVTNAVLQPIQI